MEKDDQLHIIKHEKAFTVEGFVAYLLLEAPPGELPQEQMRHKRSMDNFNLPALRHPLHKTLNEDRIASYRASPKLSRAPWEPSYISLKCRWVRKRTPAHKESIHRGSEFQRFSADAKI